ncbi:Cytochrome P450 monooxygenase [Hyphodiscus hymeniophilus]|uniref:Cytochrome P450 monooxygenase n=1 Tax=Hyphodiscus hymeniophilus TaxID=353542 RepID=A0A9P6SKS1_9HELO|nr:Cytochrome P450 monooxygenase [Hyphodiscus hymeniophilus]
MSSLSSPFGDGSISLFILVTAAVPLWACGIAIYRLWLSPLAEFPGRKLAALTGWYETYFDCMKRGRYWVEIERMHKEYGPIIRISPWELHVNDPEWNEPYKISSRVNKYHWYYKFVGSSDAAFGTSDHDLHRIRRKAQQGYFTLDAVARFDPVLDEITSKLSRRLEEFRGTGQPANLSNAFRSLATDVVTKFSFHKAYNLLDQHDFSAAFQKTLRDFPEIGLWHRHFGLILDIMDMMPRWMVKIMNPSGIDVLDFFNDIGNQTKAIIKSYGGAKSGDYGRPNVIHQMLDSPNLPVRDKSESRLALEVRTFVGAGTETTGNTLSVTAFHLLANPEKALKLKEEVQAAQNKSSTSLRPTTDDSPSPQSSLKAYGGTDSRLPRINTREAITYKTYQIPVNTPVSMTQRLTHYNKTIFPSPETFLPERWLDPSERRRLEKYLQPFGRGSRACIGLHLASSELYVTIAMLFGQFDMRLFETEEYDIKQVHDFFSPFPDSERGLRVTIE